jgi:hypothetical protein
MIFFIGGFRLMGVTGIARRVFVLDIEIGV